MAKLGIYDVVLPFLLVFTIVFALLEKTKALGLERGKDDKEYTKKNLNAMVAFVMGFLVVASAQLVAVINKTMSQVFILLLLIVCFLMLAGAFHKQTKDGFFLNSKDHGFYYTAFMAITFIVIIAIFLNSLGWLELIYEFLKDHWNTSYVAAVIFIIAIIGFMAWIMKDPSDSKDAKKEDS
ncbi:MAG: hypothetical protein ACP5NV_02735 [Candidatus Woesearchaeota archaeon]